MLLLLLGRLPQTTDSVEWGGWRFEIVDMDGKRIDKVLATPYRPSKSPTPRPEFGPALRPALRPQDPALRPRPEELTTVRNPSFRLRHSGQPSW